MRLEALRRRLLAGEEDLERLSYEYPYVTEEAIQEATETDSEFIRRMRAAGRAILESKGLM